MPRVNLVSLITLLVSRLSECTQQVSFDSAITDTVITTSQVATTVAFSTKLYLVES